MIRVKTSFTSNSGILCPQLYQLSQRQGGVDCCEQVEHVYWVATHALGFPQFFQQNRFGHILVTNVTNGLKFKYDWYKPVSISVSIEMLRNASFVPIRSDPFRSGFQTENRKREMTFWYFWPYFGIQHKFELNLLVQADQEWPNTNRTDIIHEQTSLILPGILFTFTEITEYTILF